MCINLTFYPLVYDTYTKKKRIVFSYPVGLETYDYLKTLPKNSILLKYQDLFGYRFNCFNKDEVFEKFVQVPCGSCTECLNSRAKANTYRILKECEQHDSCWFLTLTYSEENLPSDYQLEKDAISKFNKKLKTYLSRKGLKSDFRFYGVGEYGSKSGRPHYHVIYFGLNIPDLKFYKANEFGDDLYTSNFLESIWGKGFVVIGSVTSSSAAYVARYCDKKLSSRLTSKDYAIVPEFSVQSMNPGIGAAALPDIVKMVSNGVYSETIRGSTFSFPKYYMDKVKKILEYSPELLAYEKRNQLLSEIRYTKLLLTHGSSYFLLSHDEDLQKKKGKCKRKLC